MKYLAFSFAVAVTTFLIQIYISRNFRSEKIITSLFILSNCATAAAHIYFADAFAINEAEVLFHTAISISLIASIYIGRSDIINIFEDKNNIIKRLSIPVGLISLIISACLIFLWKGQFLQALFLSGLYISMFLIWMFLLKDNKTGNWL